MESVSDESAQIENNAGSQLGPTCLRIPQVLRQILEHFSNKELLQLSLVNKQWNYEARSVIKDRGTMIAHPDTQQLCKDLAVFASHVGHMNVVPYSGICVYFKHHAKEEDPRLTYPALNSPFDVLLNRLQLKHFELGFDGFLVVNHVCPAFLLVEKILRDHCGVLESLNVGVQYNFEEFIRRTVQHSTFPRLRTLKLGTLAGRSEGSETELIKTMVSRAPNLQELHLDHPVDFHTDLLAGSSAVLVLDSEINLLDVEIHDRLIGALRLRRMRLQYNTGRNFSATRFKRIVPVLLRSSSSTLESLSLYSKFAPSLMRFGIRLENLTELEISKYARTPGLCDPPLPPNVSTVFWRILQDFDFTHISPKLNEVQISSLGITLREIHEPFDQRNVTLQESRPDRAINIKHLRIKSLQVGVPFVASVFPHIETVAIESWMGPAVVPFGLIWEHWVYLKQLVFHAEGLWQRNWDSWFCGLFPEEIAELREKDEDYLKAVNIVPVMPSITCLKELRTFTLFNKGYGSFSEEGDLTLMLSKVTALTAFSRCPNLNVTLHINSKWENAWSHMKNYASIVLVD